MVGYISGSNNVQVERVTSATDEVRSLIEALDRELSESYSEEQRHGISLDAIFQPNVRFFVAKAAGLVVGCGGIALLAEFAEVKRMFVRKESRGQGIADQLIETLQAEALAAGETLLRLETGVHQPAAIRFYQRHGFQPCVVFEPYSSMPPDSIGTSVFLEKRLIVI